MATEQSVASGSKADSKRAEPPATAAPRAAYAWFVVIICTACYTLAHIDRQILGVLVTPVKSELHLTDTQVSLLAGLAFALFYSFMGLPFGRAADRYSRRGLIIAGVLSWTGMTVLCSAARGFIALFIARVGVGVGEASLSPAATSLIADYVPRERLATALGVYHMGISIGGGLALLVGGMVVQAVAQHPYVQLPLLGVIASWRITFIVVGLPGLLLALLLLAVKEPLRRHQLRNADASVVQLSMSETLRYMKQRLRSVLGIGCGMAFVAACNFANLLWAPSLLQRIHHWEPRRIGIALGIVVLVFGCIGTFIGGHLADRWYRRGMTDAYLRVGLIGALGCTVSFVFAYASSDAHWVIAFMAPATLCVALPSGATFAAIQLIFPNQLRGSVGALFVLILTLTGTTLGPLVPALISDYWFRDEQAIGTSLLCCALVFGVASMMSFAVTLGDYRRQYALARAVES